MQIMIVLTKDALFNVDRMYQWQPFWQMVPCSMCSRGGLTLTILLRKMAT